jgi:hypothetical protein
MKKLGKIKLTGASGASYDFRVYPWESEFGAEGAVYIVTKRKGTTGGRHWHSRLFAGQTSDLSASVADHRKSSALQSRSPNCICVHTEETESKRRTIESDLMSLYRPPGNDPVCPDEREPHESLDTLGREPRANDRA